MPALRAVHRAILHMRDTIVGPPDDNPTLCVFCGKPIRPMWKHRFCGPKTKPIKNPKGEL